MSPKPFSKKMTLNIIFAVVCVSLLAFLYLAPDESTPRLPLDDLHKDFHKIESKKQAERACASCHSDTGQAPLPDNHPPPYRCLFCHKRNQP